ncbi:MAG: cation:proton antiporter [Thermodesulfobacteriota bacterium]
MRLLVAGAGKTARELLRQLGQAWSVTLIDLTEAALAAHQDHPQVVTRVAGDASSPLVLDQAELGAHDFVAALTNRDDVNYEVCRQARKRGIHHAIALVNDSRQVPRFRELAVRTICSSQLVARDVQLFLESPRLVVTTIAEGAGEVMELSVLRKAPAVGQAIRSFAAGDWLIAAIHRQGRLIIPHGSTVIEAGDRRTIVGRAGLYRSIASFFCLEEHCFPLEYGQRILLPATASDKDLEPAMGEALYLVANSRAQGLTILGPPELAQELQTRGETLGPGAPLSFRLADGPWEEVLARLTLEESIGCVVTLPRPLGPLARLLGLPSVIALAHRLACPLLVSRQTMPYRRILVSRTALGQTVLVCATMADFCTLLGLTGLVLFQSHGWSWRLIGPLLVFLLFGLVLWAVRLRAWWFPHRARRLLGGSDPQELGVRAAFALLFVFVGLSELLGLEPILGAFMGGAILALVFESRGLLEEKLAGLSFGFLIPVFFIHVGIGFPLAALASPGYLALTGQLLAAAIVVKLLPSLLLRLHGLSWRQCTLAGILLSARLSLIIAAAGIGVDQGLLPPDLQPAIITLALATASASPILFRRLALAWLPRPG